MDSLDSHRLAAEKLQVYMAINSSPLTHHWSAARATAALKPGHGGYKVMRIASRSANKAKVFSSQPASLVFRWVPGHVHAIPKVRDSS